MANLGKAIGGPLDGAELSSHTATYMHSWREPGEDELRHVKYWFVDGAWRLSPDAEPAAVVEDAEMLPPKGTPTKRMPVKRKPKGK